MFFGLGLNKGFVNKRFWKSLFVPLSLAMVPILFLYARNTDIVTFEETIRITLLSLLLVSLLFLLFKKIFKDLGKASFTLSFIIFTSFLFGQLSRVLPYFEVFKLGDFIFGRNFLLLIMTIALIFLMMFYVLKTKKQFVTYLRFFLWLSIFLNLFNLTLILNNLLFSKDQDIELELNKARYFSVSKLDYVPDIYYLVLDGHAREDVLEQIFAYSNRPFIESLESDGFYVAGNSRANYIYTYASLGSALNYDYLDTLLGEKYKHGENNSKILTEVIGNNKTARRLKNLGYKYIVFDSGFSGTENSPLADVKYTYSHGLNNFENSVVNTNIFSRMLYFLRVDTNKYHRERILFIFDKLGEIASIDKPTFTFAHVISPHPPFVFNEDGSATFSNVQFSLADGSMYRGTYEQYKSGYLKQLIYIDKLVIQTVKEIFTRSENPPIIIIQSDHGPATIAKGKKGAKRAFLSSYVDDKSEISIWERTGILNAYYFPRVNKNVFYPTISPINSFRLLFNTYFESNFELLEDKTFVDR